MDVPDSVEHMINHQEDESSSHHPPARQTLFQALGISEWAQQHSTGNGVPPSSNQGRIYPLQENSGLLQEMVNQGSNMPSLNQSRRPFSSVGRPISITP